MTNKFKMLDATTFISGLRCHFNIDLNGERYLDLNTYPYTVIESNNKSQIIKIMDASNREYNIYFDFKSQKIIYNTTLTLLKNDIYTLTHNTSLTRVDEFNDVYRDVARIEYLFNEYVSNQKFNKNKIKINVKEVELQNTPLKLKITYVNNNIYISIFRMNDYSLYHIETVYINKVLMYKYDSRVKQN